MYLILDSINWKAIGFNWDGSRNFGTLLFWGETTKMAPRGRWGKFDVFRLLSTTDLLPVFSDGNKIAHKR